MDLIKARIKNVFNIKLSEGKDLLNAIREIANKYNIESGSFFAFGTLKKAHMSYYKPKLTPYVREEPLEIISCVGTIKKSGKDLSVHSHICVADFKLNCYGGHLLEGSIVDALADITVFQYTK